jgi:hypothetical protein
MRTPSEALFDAMVTGGWMTASSGDVESPTGHFAYASYAPDEIDELYDAMSDTIGVYGRPDPADVIGHHIVTTDSQGSIGIERYPTEAAMKSAYRELEDQYAKWADS